MLLAQSFGLVDALPETSISADSRAALQAFLTAGARADGVLTLSARSEPGVGLLQMVGGLRLMEEAGFSTPAMADGLDVLMSGVSLSADWTPGG